MKAFIILVIPYIENEDDADEELYRIGLHNDEDDEAAEIRRKEYLDNEQPQ